jgi:hypothetical protein
MSDPLADLKRRAYAPTADEHDAEAARAELARIAAREHPAAAPRDDWYIPSTTPFAIAGGRLRLLLAVAALTSVAGALAFPSPGASLAVFDREPTPDDLAAPRWAIHTSAGDAVYGADSDTVRWLADHEDARLYAYRTPAGFVCLSLVKGDWGSGTCASPDEFAANGITLGLGLVAGGPELTVAWGPTGDPRFYNGPAPESEDARR